MRSQAELQKGDTGTNQDPCEVTVHVFRHSLTLKLDNFIEEHFGKEKNHDS